jgi:hypothetical protein
LRVRLIIFFVDVHVIIVLQEVGLVILFFFSLVDHEVRVARRTHKYHYVQAYAFWVFP